MKKIGILFLVLSSIFLFAQEPTHEIYNQRSFFDYEKVDGDKAKIPAWKAIGPKGGYINSMDFNPKNNKEIYATMNGQSGYIYRTKNSGKKWEKIALLDNYLYDIALDPKNPDILYVLAGWKIFKSKDKGKKWQEYRFLSSSYQKAPNEYASCCWGIAINPKNTNVLYATGNFYKTNSYKYGMAVFKSSNGGETWDMTKLTSNSQYAEARCIAINPSNPSIVYAAGYYRDGNYSYRVFKSTDGGNNWTNITGNIVGTPCAIVIDKNNPSKVYVGTGWGVYRSSNGGQTWQKNQGNAYGYDLAIDPLNSNIIYADYSNSCYKSIDGGVTWTEYSQGILGRCSSLLIPSQSSSSYGGQVYAQSNQVYYGSSAGFFKSSNGGVAFKESNSGLLASSVPALAVAPSSSRTIYAETSSGLFKSTKSGKGWKRLPYEHACGAIMKIAVNPNKANELYALEGG